MPQEKMPKEILSALFVKKANLLNRNYIFGDERISTGILNPDKRAVEWHHYKSHNFKITDNNKTVLAAA